MIIFGGLGALTACTQSALTPSPEPIAASPSRIYLTATVTPTLYETETLAPSSTPLPTETRFPSFTPYRSPTATPTHTPTHSWPSPTPYQSRGDLNIHTDCSVGFDSYSWMAFEAEYWHYDFIAISDYHWCPEVITECKNDTRILCFPGLAVNVESVGQQNDRMILAIGIRKEIQAYLPLSEAVAIIHAQGGLAIAAYPYAEGHLYTRDELLNSGLDAMECPRKGDNPFADITGDLSCVYDSDAVHRLEVEPYSSFACDMKIESLEDLRGALHSGKCHR